MPRRAAGQTDEALARALDCLPFRRRKRLPLNKSDVDRASAFAEAAAASDAALWFSHKVIPSAVLEEIADHLARHFYSQVAEDDRKRLILSVEWRGRTRRHRLPRGRKPTRHEAVAAFAALWPKAWTIWALRPFEDGDDTVYLVLHRDQVSCLRAALGDLWDRVFLATCSQTS